jgi:excisionase family DNA binding protein
MDFASANIDDAGEFDRGAAMAAWASFVDGRPFAQAAVRDIVLDSWRRSRNHGIDARSLAPAVIETGEALGARLAANRELMIAADHTWQLLAESLVASDNVLIVADATGTLLAVRGNAEFVQAAERQSVRPGRDWSEPVSGTNAIGTALVLKRPVIIRSVEHYCETAKIWDCAASPIHDLTDGTIVGVLDVTSVGDLSGEHTLALAITAAHQVEHMLHSQALARSVQLLNWQRSIGARWRGRPVVLLDNKGRILRANDSAQAAFDGVTPRFEVRDALPAVQSGDGVQILETLGYEPPPDPGNEPPPPGWHGGLVAFAIDASRIGVDRSDPRQSLRRDIHPAFRRIVTKTPAVLDLMRQAKRMARAHSPILLTGETGTGKELFARAIHECSAVANGPFVAVNCGTLTRELAASELLGHVAGAFTGASHKGRPGKFELADGGTLFLDEIGELPLDVQVHLLRVLQDNVVVPVGGNQERVVRVRIIAATHRNLERDAEDGRFRTDLLFRLRVLVLALPPLRTRRDDVPPLIEHTLQSMQSTYGLGTRDVAEELRDVLVEYPWPGNVRELRGLIESMYILSDRPLLTRRDLPESFVMPATAGSPTAPRATTRAQLDAVERDALVEAIARCAHNMTGAANYLGISRSTLYRKMKHHGIERPRTGRLAGITRRDDTT